MSKNRPFPFTPALFTSLKGYNGKLFAKDAMAGIIVGIVALPLAIAFGIASGVTPEKGIITAIIAGFLASFFGGCNVQISGPTGAFIIIVYGIVQKFGVEGLAIATFIAGVLLVLMGVFRIGTIIRYIPYPIIVGFTSGIALIIFTTQIKDLFGMQIADLPGSFSGKWIAYFKGFDTIDPWALGIGMLTILIIIYTPRIFKKVPGSLIAIVSMTVLAYILRSYFGIDSVETIGDRFRINAELPQVQGLGLTFEKVNVLFSAGITIALLGAIESLLSATVADGVTGQKHDSNTELIGQGIANVVAPLFGGIPATGAIARTMTNINNGGRTPVSGIIHAAVLLVVLLFLGNLSGYIPMACLAGVLVIVAYNMSEWRTFKGLMKTSRADIAVLLTTFLLTVLFDLTIAIEVGILLAIVMFIKRVSNVSNISLFKETIEATDNPDAMIGSDNIITLPKGVEVYEIDGPFFFGIATKFDATMKVIGDRPKIRIIRMRKVPFMDSTGLHNLEILYKNCKKEHIHVILSGVNNEVRNMLDGSGFTAMIGEENICSNIHDALNTAKRLLE